MVEMESSTVWNALDGDAGSTSHNEMMMMMMLNNTTPSVGTQFRFVNPTTSASRVAILVTYLVLTSLVTKTYEDLYICIKPLL